MAKVVKTVRIQKSQGVKLCEDMLYKKLGREEILQQITKSYKISVGAIDKWIKIAKPAAETRHKEAETIRIEQTKEAELQALKEGLVSDLELEVFLSQIAVGGVNVCEMAKGMVVIRDVSPLERLKAIDLLFKKRGSNASSKLEITGKDGVQLFKFGYGDDTESDN